MSNENTTQTVETAASKNYTAEQELRMVEVYQQEPTQETVEALAKEFNKSVHSVRGKLVSLDVYIPQEKRAASTGRVTKAQMAANIAEHLFGDPSNTQGLENCNSAALRILQEPGRVEKYLESLRGE